MMRGRTALAGELAASLRLKAHQQKMALRTSAEAFAASRSNAAGVQSLGSNTLWVPLGPAPLLSDRNFFGPVAGRVTGIAIDPTDSTGNTVYAAAASGGVWKSSNAASASATDVTWTPLTDQRESLVNGAVSVKPDGSVVLVGTGEPNSAIDSYYGVGVLRSTDHGSSWNLISTTDGGANSFAGLGFSKFAWSTATSSTVLAATGTTAKGFDEGEITGSTNRGLYYSNDSGQNWAFQIPRDGGVAISPASISATDAVYNSVAGRFFAVIRYHGVYSSTNGQNWTRLTNQPNPTRLNTTNCPSQIPAGGSNCPLYRGQLTVVPGRQEMYFWSISLATQGGAVVAADEGIWRSLDGGNSWAQINEGGLTNCGDPGNNGCGAEQGYYNLEIAAVPDGQATDLYAGAVNLFKCKLTGGTTCSTLDSNFPNQWINLTHVYGCSSIAAVHPDEHGVDFAIVGGKAIIYFANDGGVYRTLDGLTKLSSGTCGVANDFDNLNESSVANGTIGSLTQFVSFSIHPTDQDTVLGGTQDNGSPATSAATTSSEWTTVNGGDGGYSAIDFWTPTQWYTANNFVNIYSCANGADCTTDTFNLTVGSAELGGDEGAFYTPYILDPKNPTEMLVGTCRVWRGMPTVPPSSFTAISVDFDTLGQTTCTGAEINLVAGLAEGGPTADGLSTTAYATTEGTGPNAASPAGGEVWVTTNAGITQMAEVTGAINPSHYTISSVAVDTNDATGATAYVGTMGFHVAHVFKTTNSGAKWSDWSGSDGTALPDAPVNALLVDAPSATVYAGTDVGVFMSSTASASWTELGVPSQPGGLPGYLPNVPATAIRMYSNAGTKKIRVSTYGRGIWEYALALAPDYTNVISNSPQTVFPGQTATFNGKLTAVGGYASPVNLSCTGTTPSTCTLNPTQATPTATFTVTAGGAVGDYSFNAHAVGTDSQKITHDAPITLHVVDFGLTAPNPNALTVQQCGTSNASTFQVTAAGSFSGTVNLSCPSGLPTGAACQFSPSNAVTPTAGNPITVTVTVTAAANTPPGGPTAVTLAANVSGAPAAKTQTFTLTVTAPVGDFSLAVTETPNTTIVGQNVTWNGTLTAVNGYNASVSLSCVGAAPETCALNPASLTPTPTGAAFTVTVGSANAAAFNFGIQGTDGTLTHSQPASLTVSTDVTWTDTGSSSATVTAGGKAIYTFSAAPSGGSTFSSTVSFQCANLPSLTSCSFSPSSIAGGDGTTSVTVTVATTAPSRAEFSTQHLVPGDNLSPRGANKVTTELALAWWMGIPIAGMTLAGAARRRPSRNQRIAICALGCASLLLMAACGGLSGGGGGGGGGGGTPPGTYSNIQITATAAGGTAHTELVALTVN